MSITGLRASAVAVLTVAAVVAAGCSAANNSAGNGAGATAAGVGQDYGTEQEETGTGPMVSPTIPLSPSLNELACLLNIGHQA